MRSLGSKRTFVTVRGETYYVYEPGELDLSGKIDYDGIIYGSIVKDITEIKGLENLKGLPILLLDYNEITEIKGLENLTNLRELGLGNNWITEIKGLSNLTNLQLLDLSQNEIKEIKGLDTLTNLEELDLSSNSITKLKGLENLTNLQKIDLSGNPIRDDEKHFACIGLKDAQELMKYCQEKAKKLKEGG